MNLYDDITKLNGVGKQRAAALNKLGIFNIYDLLTFYPRTYLDFSQTYSIAQAPLDVYVSVKATVGSKPRVHIIRKGMTTYTFEVTDGANILDLVFFNNKYIANMLPVGKEFVFYGKINQLNPFYKSMTSPKFIEYNSSGMIEPVYPQTAQINSRQILKLVKTAFDSVDNIEDCLPEKLKNDYCLMSLKTALMNIHFPENQDSLSEAKRRMTFEELLTLQLGLSRLKIKSRQSTPNVLTNDLSGEFINSLPFTLTGAQKRAIRDCTQDMMSGFPMNRLLQGDVGSGKTAVAAALSYNAVKNGYQVAVMAPTEVLAQQHYNTFTLFFEKHNFNVSLLTGSVGAKQKREIKERTASGETDILIGTHAIIQKDVEFLSLGLAVTDEQHRFGVNQRNLLSKKGKNPHVLVMSATPIPRTLSLIIYGDLDISILDELPKGRKVTETYLVDTSKRERAYGYVKKHLIDGYQGYIVCPLVDLPEENDNEEQIAATELFKELENGFFKGFKLGLLYGKMKSEDKKDVMKKFSEDQIDLLISTTVIEVGVDVPNAVIMVIENADRYGLSQIHQLRGRVGRGDVKSTCILISDNADKESSERLKILTSTADGFKIADEDLRLRGPGDFIGSRQHGLPDIKSANLLSDGETVRETHLAAEKMLEKNPTLEGEEYELLKKRVNNMFAKGVTLN